MKILVTGGTGYIGSHTVVELILKGYSVIIVDNLSNSSIEVLDSIESITGTKPDFENLDLTDTEKTNVFFKNNLDIKAIIHFAALKYVGESMQEPLKYYHNNVFSLINILKSMQKYNIENLVFSSSCTVYGQPDKLPVSEDMPFNQYLSPYGNTKQIAEEIIKDCTKKDNIRCISLRYFNPIGAHDSIMIGELPIGTPQNLIPYITQTAIGLRNELKVYGNNYPTPDGTCIRDYIHVTDLALAHIAALDRLINSKIENDYEAFNIGTGRGNSVLEIINTFEKVSETKLNYIFEKRRDGDVAEVWADNQLALEKLNWKPFKTLEQMLKSSWEWQKYYSKKRY